MLYKAIRNIVMLLALMAVCIQHTHGQKSNYVDTGYTLLGRAELINGCLDTFYKPDYYYIKDSMLRDFFGRIDTKGYYDIPKGDTATFLSNLLERAKGETIKVCMLPFYRLLDVDANDVYKNNCRTSPRALPYMNYCTETDARYAILFYIHFTQVQKVKLKQGEAFSVLELRKDGCDKQASFKAEDYSTLFKLYADWLSRKNINNKKNAGPLKNSRYRWAVLVGERTEKIKEYLKLCRARDRYMRKLCAKG